MLVSAREFVYQMNGDCDSKQTASNDKRASGRGNRATVEFGVTPTAGKRSHSTNARLAWQTLIPGKRAVPPACTALVPYGHMTGDASPGALETDGATGAKGFPVVRHLLGDLGAITCVL